MCHFLWESQGDLSWTVFLERRKKQRKILWFLVKSLIQEKHLWVSEFLPCESSSYHHESNDFVRKKDEGKIREGGRCKCEKEPCARKTSALVKIYWFPEKSGIFLLGKRKYKVMVKFSFLHRDMEKKKGFFRTQSLMQASNSSLSNFTAERCSKLPWKLQALNWPGSRRSQTVIKILIHYFVQTLIQSKQKAKFSD